MRKIAFSILLLTFSLGVVAQSYVDLVRYARPDDIGSARYMALGGAFSALGNDFSAVSMNPAGIAVYRHPEMSISTYFRNTQTTTSHYGDDLAWNDNQLRFSQLGFVFHANAGHDSHVNIGLRYNRTNDYGFDQRIDASDVNSSVLQEWEAAANQFAGGGQDLFQSGLVYEALANDVGLLEYQNNMWSRTSGGSAIRQQQSFNSNGGKGIYAIDLGLQTNNRWNIGVSLEIPTLTYSYSETYTESNYDAGSYARQMDWRNEYDILGVGVQLKFGLIFTPEDYGRFSAYLHTPTWWGMRQEGETEVTSFPASGGVQSSFLPFNTYNFSVQTPMKFGVGYAYVFEKNGLISIDYAIQGMQYAEASSPEFPGELDYINEDAQNFLQTWHDLRAGAEWRIDKFFVRGGIHYTTTAFEEGTDIASQYATGFGYKENKWGLDVTYSLRNRQNEFYLYAPELVAPTSRVERGHFIVTTVYFRL